MKLRIKAFTMLEALISLILTGIIIALCYSLFTLINKQMALFEKENTEVVNYNLFNATLLNDIDKSNNFSYKDKQLVLNYYYSPDVIYEFKTQGITRTLKGANTDRFSTKIYNQLYLENELSQQGQLQLSLKLLNDTLSANYFLKKQTSSVINKKLFNED